MNLFTWKFNLLTLLTLLVVTAACYVWVYAIAIKKDTDYRYRSASLAELYFPSDQPAIKGFQFPNRGEMVLEISPAPPVDSSWTITADGTSPYTTTGQYPKISLLKKEHSYTLRRDSGASIPYPLSSFTLKIDYSTKELYEAYNDGLADTYRIISSTIPVGDYKGYPVGAFIDEAYFSKDILEARRILSEKVGIDSSDSTREKIEKIGLFILSGIDDRRGMPVKGLSQEAMAEYKCALNGTSKIWCVQFARIYALFANVAGIPTRFVSLGGRVDGVSLSAHGFTESFIKETGKWAYVDLFSRILFVTNSNNDLLNTLDLFMLQLAGGNQELSAMVFKDKGVTLVPYMEIADDIAYYFNRDATFIFGRKKFQPLRQYRRLELAVTMLLNPELSYSLKNSSQKYFLAVGLFYAALALSFTWLLLFVRHLIHHQRSSA